MRNQQSTVAERFWSKVDLDGPSGCWLWMAARDSDGYGAFKNSGRQVGAHRFAYELLVGPVAGGLELDHLCRVHACVRPEHLEAITHAENVQRGEGGEWQRAKTHCPQGHPYDEPNTYVGPQGERHCRACVRAASHRYRSRQGAV